MSDFPQAIDNFANPITTKVNGVDVVRAEHVNDLQSAMVAVQQLLIVGLPINYTSNQFIADNISFKQALEVLDDQLGGLTQDFQNHRDFALVSDPAQHHANVIEVTPIGNLASDRVQLALQEHQSDIDAIMTGGFVEGVTLDDRYVNKAGNQQMQGNLTIDNAISVGTNSQFGATASHNHDFIGSLSVDGEVVVQGDVHADDGYSLNEGSKVFSDPDYSYISFNEMEVELYSKKDFVVRLDSDEAVDALSQMGEFKILDGLGNQVYLINEDGHSTQTASSSATRFVASDRVRIGDELDILEDLLDIKAAEYHVQLDKTNVGGASRFFITRRGDTGNNLTSSNHLLDLDTNANLITGRHILKPGIQEVGFFGLKTYSPNAGGVFFGNGVNFKHQMYTQPASITLTVTENVNASNIAITSINEYGFFWEFDTPDVGEAKVVGTYETSGN